MSVHNLRASAPKTGARELPPELAEGAVGYKVVPRGQDPQVGPHETDQQFLARLNEAFTNNKPTPLPRLHGLTGGEDGWTILGLRWLQVYRMFAEVCFEVKPPVGNPHDAILEVHTAGEDNRACMVIPFVRTPDGPHVCMVRESRYTLFFDEREMTLVRKSVTGEAREPRSGWVNAFSRGFSVSASAPAIADAQLTDVPFDAPLDEEKLIGGAKSVAARKLASLFLPRRQRDGSELPPIARPVRGTFLDGMPENTGRSATWIWVYALEVAFDDPALYDRYVVKRGRFGPDYMKGRFVPFEELLTKAGRHSHDFVDAFSVAGRGLFSEALLDGRIEGDGKGPLIQSPTSGEVAKYS